MPPYWKNSKKMNKKGLFGKIFALKHLFQALESPLEALLWRPDVDEDVAVALAHLQSSLDKLRVVSLLVPRHLLQSRKGILVSIKEPSVLS